MARGGVGPPSGSKRSPGLPCCGTHGCAASRRRVHLLLLLLLLLPPPLLLLRRRLLLLRLWRIPPAEATAMVPRRKRRLQREEELKKRNYVGSSTAAGRPWSRVRGVEGCPSASCWLSGARPSATGSCGAWQRLQSGSAMRLGSQARTARATLRERHLITRCKTPPAPPGVVPSAVALSTQSRRRRLGAAGQKCRRRTEPSARAGLLCASRYAQATTTTTTTTTA